jgi:carbon storage regulator
MLVLSRKLGETVVVPALDVQLTILSVDGNRVRLGVIAPAGVAVHRQEVWDRITGRRPNRRSHDGRGDPTGQDS